MWSGPLGVVVLVIILVGVAGLAYFVMRTSRAMPLPRRPDERDTLDVQRDAMRFQSAGAASSTSLPCSTR